MDLVRSALPSSPMLAVIAVIAFIATSYCFALLVYRLFLHPIAQFPGPKLAGLTRWYEFYYEIIQKGQMTFHIQDLHRKYGKP